MVIELATDGGEKDLRAVQHTRDKRLETSGAAAAPRNGPIDRVAKWARGGIVAQPNGLHLHRKGPISGGARLPRPATETKGSVRSN